MQNTRLNNLFDTVLTQTARWLRNPWRRVSLVVISLLSGIFLGTAIPTTAGQAAGWDITGAAILIAFTEAISWFVYNFTRRVTPTDGGVRNRFIVADILNALKVGLTYSLFVEAFKLGS